MWLRMVFEVAIIKGSLLMLKCLILMLPLIRLPACLHCIVDLRKKSRGSMSNAFVKMGCFTPLVFSTFGGMSTICNISFIRLTSLLADKREVSYDVVMSWLHCRVSFSLLRSAIDCLRGARSSKGHAAVSFQAFDLALSEGRMSLNH